MVFALDLVYSYLCAMFIRQVKKSNAKEGKTFYQYQLVQASRIEGKVQQRNILYLGSVTLLADAENRKKLLQVLQSMIFGQPLLFAKNHPKEITDLAAQYHKKFLIKYKDLDLGSIVSIPPQEKELQTEDIALNSIEIEDSRTFGGEYLCSQIMEVLDLGTCFEALGFSKNENRLAHVGIIGRALFSASEHKTAQYLKDNSGLCDLHHISAGDTSYRSHRR